MNAVPAAYLGVKSFEFVFVKLTALLRASAIIEKAPMTRVVSSSTRSQSPLLHEIIRFASQLGLSKWLPAGSKLGSNEVPYLFLFCGKFLEERLYA